MADPISLGTIGMAASGASGAAGIFGSLFGGSAKSDAYKYQSSMAWQNAAIARQNEKYAFDVGEQQAERLASLEQLQRVRSEPRREPLASM